MEIDKNGVKNGLAQLFDNGVIQMSWRMVDGKREGGLTVYENGIVNCSITWDSFGKDVTREVVNDESGNRLLIERNWKSRIITYKGDYNHVALDREGFGIEYDVESGVEKYYGYYCKDMLIHIKQLFVKKSSMKSKARVAELSKRRSGKNGNKIDANEIENDDNEMMMIEFGGNEDEENVEDVTNRHPVYMGGYRFDQKRNKFIRCGLGYEYNEFSGICDTIGEWNENGEKKRGSERKLYGGWYGEGEFDQSIRLSEIDEEARKRREEEEERRIKEEEVRRMKEIVPICSQLNLNQIRGIEEFVIGNNSMNGRSGNISGLKLELTDLPRLKRIEIGSNSFQNVRGFVLKDLLNLHEITVGVELL